MTRKGIILERANVRDGLTVKLPDGRKLGYAEFGDPSGRPLLYFHGGISSRLDIAFGAPLLAERGLRLIAPDRPGIGASTRNPNPSLVSWAKDVEVLMNELDLNGLPILGWSLGGPYVLVCAHRLGDRLTRVATMGSGAPLSIPGAIADLGLSIDRMIMNCPKQFRFALKLYMEVVGALPPKLVRNETEKELKHFPADLKVVQEMPIEELTDFLYESICQGGDGIIDDYWNIRVDWGFDLNEIKNEVLLFYGKEDRICPGSFGKYLNENIPNSKLIMVENVGHFMMHRRFPMLLDAIFDESGNGHIDKTNWMH